MPAFQPIGKARKKQIIPRKRRAQMCVTFKVHEIVLGKSEINDFPGKMSDLQGKCIFLTCIAVKTLPRYFLTSCLAEKSEHSCTHAHLNFTFYTVTYF